MNYSLCPLCLCGELLEAWRKIATFGAEPQWFSQSVNSHMQTSRAVLGADFAVGRFDATRR